MNRLWAYLAALFPLTTLESSLSHAAGSTSEDIPEDSNRWKRKRPDEDDEEEESEDQGANKKSATDSTNSSEHDEEASSDGSTSDSAGGGSKKGSGGIGDSLGESGASPAASATGSDGMYAPTGSGAEFAGGAGGGSGGGGGASGGGGGTGSGGSGGGQESVTTADMSALTNGTSGPNNPLPPLPGGTGYVEPNLADADAMAILLGGGAVAAGDGASTTGDVQLDIVDYGLYTVAEGYAIYTAQGQEAEADTFAHVEGADLFYTVEYNSPSVPAYLSVGQSGETSYSYTYVIAVDFEFDFGAYYASQLLGGSPSIPWITDHDENDIQIDGNVSDLAVTIDLQGEDAPPILLTSAVTDALVGSALGVIAQSEQAQLSITAQALGFDTLTSGSGSITEIEDHFSAVTGSVVAIA